MKAIILAAGEGKRLRPLTEHQPKCLVEYKGKAIIDYQLEAMQSCGIKDIVVVKGYKAEALQREEVRFIINTEYTVTNMVHTLFCAEKELTEELIISYGDIIYKKYILETLIACDDDVAVIVDNQWRLLWEQRMADPLSDAETMKIASNGEIQELGKSPKNYDDIQGQYIGLIKFSKNAINKIREFYYYLKSSNKQNKRDFDNMYMTSFIQLIIDYLMPVKAVIINGGWIEIDTPSDLLVNFVPTNDETSPLQAKILPNVVA